MDSREQALARRRVGDDVGDPPMRLITLRYGGDASRIVEVEVEVEVEVMRRCGWG